MAALFSAMRRPRSLVKWPSADHVDRRLYNDFIVDTREEDAEGIGQWCHLEDIDLSAFESSDFSSHDGS